MSDEVNNPTNPTAAEKAAQSELRHKAIFPTLEEAQAVKPPSDKFRVFKVTTPDGVERFAWAHSVNDALSLVSRADGWEAAVAEPKGGGPVTKEKVAARLAEFTDEELAVMGLSRKKGKK